MGSTTAVPRKGRRTLETPVTRGPLAGEAIPLYGGQPNLDSCNGCTDCCHLPEISLTNEEADRLRALHGAWSGPIETLVIEPDRAHEGWQIMRGPCVFRQEDRLLAAGGCRVYADRPAGCEIFTCALRTTLRVLARDANS